MQSNSFLRYLTPAGLILLWWGYFGPWIQHRAAPLRMSGYMLSEWVHILPEVRAGAVPFAKPHYMLPLLLTILLTVTVLSKPGTKAMPKAAWLAIGALLAFSVYLLLVDPSILRWRDDVTMQKVIWWFAGTWVAAIVILLINIDGRGKNWSLLIQLALGVGIMVLDWWLITQVMPWIIGLFNMTPPIGNGWIASQVGGALVAVSAFAQRLQLRYAERLNQA